jgi:hypothetical protein
MQPEPSIQPEPPLAPKQRGGDRAENFGCGVAFVVGGGLMLAQRVGWIKESELLWPCILVGLGATYLYKALRKGRS